MLTLPFTIYKNCPLFICLHCKCLGIAFVAHEMHFYENFAVTGNRLDLINISIVNLRYILWISKKLVSIILILDFLEKKWTRVKSSTPGKPNSIANLFSTNSVEFIFPQKSWKMCLLSIHLHCTGILFSIEFVDNCFPQNLWKIVFQYTLWKKCFYIEFVEHYFLQNLWKIVFHRIYGKQFSIEFVESCFHRICGILFFIEFMENYSP
mgnify:CR=1 FL=1